ncbi:LIC_10190 family membrane protein [Anaeromyxobacter oryzae]|uniref:DUF8201 domain-containing protein n=1 Tax=Anaeromyxobacter oryzae TaxID=2918170 RepID=A0ABM7X320_9BACT|nr:hypothetical protein [Anaeromyxobacter oryzae]BDG06198.1 hypothetical protein AMOR_51940 [Anaeromyxobacter oryzae]
MICILLTVLAWIPSVLGYGALLRCGDAGLRRSVSGVLGLGVLAALGILLHFVVPLAPVVSACAWVLGLSLFWWRRAWLLEGLSRVELLGTVAAVLACLLLMQSPTRHYDAGLYWLQTVKWIGERRIEIGLANLHGRLAFNGTWFVLSAMLEHPLAAGRSAFFVTILPIAFASAGAVVAMQRLVDGDRTFANLVLAALVIPIAHATEGLGAQASDHALTIFIPLALALWARALEPAREFAAEAYPAALLSIFAATIKISAAPLVVGGALIVLARRASVGRRWLAGMGAAIGVAVVPWIVRSFLLSGCAVYPVAATCVDALPWAVRRSDVRTLARWIYSWARRPGLSPDQVLGNWAWVEPWTARVLERPDHRALAVLIALGLATAVASARWASRAFVVTFGIALGGVAFWFLSAPDARFAFGFLFSVALLPLAFALSRGPILSDAATRGALCVALVWCGVYALQTTGVYDRAVNRTWQLPVAAWPDLPTAVATRKVAESGYEVTVPVAGDQCWANPLPCAPQLDPRLRRDWALKVVRSGGR